MGVMDAITMLKQDHKDVEQLFKRFEKAGDGAYVEKRRIVDQIIEALSTHAAIEEQLFYPVSRATVDQTEDDVLESLEEHHVVKWLLSELDSMPPQHERFDAKVTVLIENVRHHVEEEEQELFPKVRDELGRGALNDLGEAMAAAARIAPTHPHPRSPDTPPGNLVVGTAAGVADRVGDTVSGIAQGGVSALQDVIAAILRRPRPRTSSRGSKVARDAADQVRSTTQDAIDAVRDAQRAGQRAAEQATSGARRTVRTAGTGARKTARAATSGAKGTATSARKSAKRAATTAKRASTTTGRAAQTAASTTRASATRTARSTAKAAKRSSGAPSRVAKRSTGARKRSASSPVKATAKRASSTAKTTAKRTSSNAKRTAKRAGSSRA